MLWSEASFVCHGRIVLVRPLATFSPTALGSWAHCDMTVPASAHSILQAVSALLLTRGGNRLQSLAVVYIDRNRLPCVR